MHLIAKEGLPFIALSTLMLVAAAGLQQPGLTLFMTAVTIFVTAFFRDPKRISPAGEHNLVSPADGKVVYIGPADYDAAVQPVIMISVFMSVFNVHVNRNPLSGRVKKITYHPGAFHNAARGDAPVSNERNLIVLDTPYGEVAFCQVAGLIARRIVCRIREGARVKRGERMGLIRFGSRLDIYIPKPWGVNVKLGDYVRAGSSVLAVAEEKRGA